MLRALGIALVLSVSVAGPALANRCPREIAAIDRALQTTQVSAADRERVMDLRNRGDAAHKAGNHAESERLLDEAKRILRI